MSAVVIDTFVSMREEAARRAEILSRTCFLRNIGREAFDQAVAFLGHEASFELNADSHKVWDYLLFLGHLREQEEEEHSALESYVVQHIDEDNPKWVPNGTCWVLQMAATKAKEEHGHGAHRTVKASARTATTPAGSTARVVAAAVAVS